MANVEPKLQKAGSVHVKELKLISSSDVVVDLLDFMSELNLYESVYSTHLYGDILISDSRNLIDTLPIIGEEYLNIEFFTPSFDEKGQIVKKTFRVFKVSNRQVVRDNNTQVFVLHFASIELFFDCLLPISKSFEGKISDVVQDIYFDYIASNRSVILAKDDKELKDEENYTPLTIMNETANSIKFVSPGWTPMKILTWLASKSIPDKGYSKNFLFFETNKGFYFGSLEYLFKDAIENKTLIGTYSYSPNNIKKDNNRDIEKEFFTASEMEMVDSIDHLKNYTNGYLANRLIVLDVYNKVYERVDYDHVKDYQKNYHTSGKGDVAKPIFTEDSPRNFASSISFYPKNPRLFQKSSSDYFKDNISEKMSEIYGNRLSSLIGLTNIKMNITAPGRTDIEAGNLLYFKFPALGPVSAEDSTKEKIDKNFSGYYLITSIHHRVTPQEHVMVMEIVKDSLRIDE